MGQGWGAVGLGTPLGLFSVGFGVGHWAVLCSAVLCSPMPCNAVPCSAVQCCAMQCCAMLCSAGHPSPFTLCLQKTFTPNIISRKIKEE